MMKKIAVILTPGFADWEYSLIGGPGRAYYGLDVQHFAPTEGEVRSLGGLSDMVSQDLEALSKWQSNAVVVVGGTIWETTEAPELSSLLTALHNNGAAIAGICGGTLALARAELLEDVRHTSNSAEFLAENVADYKGAAHFCASAAAVSNDRVITAPGTAPVSFAAAVFEGGGMSADAVQQFKAMMAAEHS